MTTDARGGGGARGARSPEPRGGEGGRGVGTGAREPQALGGLPEKPPAEQRDPGGGRLLETPCPPPRKTRDLVWHGAEPQPPRRSYGARRACDPEPSREP